MKKKQDIRNYTAEELAELREREGSGTNWRRVDDMTEHELNAAIESDEEERGLEPDWPKARLLMPKPKKSIHLRIDPDILDWLKSKGKGYQTRINAILRQYMDAHKRD